MRLITNAGTDRVVDLIRPLLTAGGQLDVVSPTVSLFAFAELRDGVYGLSKTRFLIPADGTDLAWLGTVEDRAARNRLHGRWLASRLANWIDERADIKRAHGGVPQGAMVVRDEAGHPQLALLGSFGFSTDGLGLTPGNPLSLIQTSETEAESAMLSQWVDAQWATLPADVAATA